jgi:plasmid stability protein
MATLNIKNFPDDVYEALREHARRSRRSVSQEVVVLISRALKRSETTSILDIRGLGKELWRNIDAAEHVDRERGSWD